MLLSAFALLVLATAFPPMLDGVQRLIGKAPAGIPGTAAHALDQRQSVGYSISGQGRRYEVYWNPYTRAVYVDYSGPSYAGVARRANEAVEVAGQWLQSR